jgi:hypothetical protein
MFTKRNSTIKQRSQNIFATFYVRKREYCVRRGNTKFVTNDFIKRYESNYNNYWRRNFGTFSRIAFASSGFFCKIIEASDRAGWAIKTDSIDGFRLDRGFQVLLTSYPEAGYWITVIQLKTFTRTTVLYDGGQFEIADPFRRPSAFIGYCFCTSWILEDKFNTFY